MNRETILLLLLCLTAGSRLRSVNKLAVAVNLLLTIIMYSIRFRRRIVRVWDRMQYVLVRCNSHEIYNDVINHFEDDRERHVRKKFKQTHVSVHMKHMLYTILSCINVLFYNSFHETNNVVFNLLLI